MNADITLWGRSGDRESAAALRFLQVHELRPARSYDIDKHPPMGGTWELLRSQLGGSLFPLVDPSHRDADSAPDEMHLAWWLADDTRRIRAPILLTPAGALVSFRQRAWTRALGLDAGPAARP